MVGTVVFDSIGGWTGWLVLWYLTVLVDGLDGWY